MFCVDKIKYEHLANLSNLKSYQFTPRIVTFSLCTYVANLRIHRLFRLKYFLWAIATFNCDKWGFIFCRKFFSFFWYIIQNFRKPNQELLYQNAFLMWSSAEWVKSNTHTYHSRQIHQNHPLNTWTSYTQWNYLKNQINKSENLRTG